MFCLNDTMRYYLCPGRTDKRKGISSLCGVVHEQMKSDVRNGDVFIFIGSSRKLMKVVLPVSSSLLGSPKRSPGSLICPRNSVFTVTPCDSKYFISSSFSHPS